MYWSVSVSINIGVVSYSLLLFLWGVFVGKKSMYRAPEAVSPSKNAPIHHFSAPRVEINEITSGYDGTVCAQYPPINTGTIARVSRQQLKSASTHTYYKPTHRNHAPPQPLPLELRPTLRPLV